MYKPELCWCVPDPPFMKYLRHSEGLTWYNEEDWHRWEDRFPFIKERRWFGPPGNRYVRERLPKAPYVIGIVGDYAQETPPEDRVYGRMEINSLFAENRLKIRGYNRYDPEGTPTQAPSLW